MSTVDKMLIKGIRSFDPENRNVVTFFKPLTLIVGPNGAGKTTIIECLKLSCTGELPPNARSGHSFIHDPKVAGETETKAQIKLRFRTAAEKDVVCIRSFQLTQKASKMEYKAIESVLQTINPHTGEKVCLSYRCADMDREVPALMGVSKAILENVIFVHQDEANWPLQDSSTLKKKFDDIFSATRYTKALEVIKKLHKDQAQEIKLLKLKLENLQNLKDAAYKLRESIAQDKEKTESLKIQMKDLEGNIDCVDAKISQIEAALKDLRKIQDQISFKTAVRSTLFKEQQKQYMALSEENEDTDEELKEWKMKFQEKIALLVNKITKLEREDEDTNTKASSLKERIDEYIWEISKLQKEAEDHISLKNERDLTIQKLFARHNLGSTPHPPFSDDASVNLTNRIRSRIFDLEKDLEEKKKANAIELHAAWERYMHANGQWNETAAQKQAKSEIKRGILKRIEEKSQDCDSLEHEISRDKLTRMDERERSMRIELERKSKEISEKNFEAIISSKKSELYVLEQRIKVVTHEKEMMAGESEDRLKLSLKKEELDNIKKKHKKIMDEYNDRLRRVLKGRLPADKDLKKEITQALSALVIEFNDLNSKSREAEKEVHMYQMKIQEANSNLAKLQKDMESRKRYIEAKIQSLDQHAQDIDSYPKILDLAKDKRDVEKSKLSIADGMRKMFEPFEQVARARHICPCCERPFSTEEEDNFVKKQRANAASSAEHIKILAVDVASADSFFQQLDKLRIVYEEFVKIYSETIPSTEKTLNELAMELELKSQILDDVVGVLAQVKTDKEAIEALVQPVESVDRLRIDIQTLQKDIDDLEYSLDFRGQNVRSMGDIHTELNTLQKSKDGLQNELENLNEERRYLELDIQSMESRWRSVREENVMAANKLQQMTKAKEELDNFVEEKGQLDLEEKQLTEALSPLAKERERMLSEYDDLKGKFGIEEEELAERKRSYQQEVDLLLKLTSKIKEYNDGKKGERLKELQEKHSLSLKQLQNCETRKKQIMAELNKSNELKSNQDQLRRNIEDNLNFRKTKAEVEELTREVESLEESLLRSGGVASHEDELLKLSRERDRLRSEFDKCQGTSSVYQSNISKNKVELKQAQFNEIDKRYFDQLIQLKTMEMANKDLDRYYNALDKALMRFHTMKMEEINKIIRELWQQTYRGQDIDNIRIHSDAEGAGTRSYSYKYKDLCGQVDRASARLIAVLK
uniref:DNA repair protein RAD50 n=1 Tax=Kalanchoe fedtschenkoi TaxID=63787 RepID=A0A7N1A2Q4_KALFE